MKQRNRQRISTILLLLSLQGLLGCGASYRFCSVYQESNALLHANDSVEVKPFLKAHLKNGDVVILRDSWQVDTVAATLNGAGFRYDPYRSHKTYATDSIPLDSVALLETNKKIDRPEEGRITALALLTAVDVSMTILCLTNPKACFGSCPTFYLDSTDDFHYADAEGFSDVVLPSMEYADVDALGKRFDSAEPFSITMKNEALETHCVKRVGLLAFPVTGDEMIYQGSTGQFYSGNREEPLAKATADEGDITDLLKAPDRQERFSLADPRNLLSREEVLLEFDPSTGCDLAGLVLHFRQTLMSTYLFYSAMGYMGDEVTDFFALAETDSVSKEKFNGIMRLLGGIDVYRWVDSTSDWRFLQKVGETGPIAINRQLVEVGAVSPGSPVRLKLILNRGVWRLDHAALAVISGVVQPLALSPVGVEKKGQPDKASLEALTSDKNYLISMPGDEYRIDFELPESDGKLQLFLLSRGYYLEWMRKHWLKDKDLLKLRLMADHPERYLRKEAFRYKRYEAYMEKEFWGSRIDTKSFTYESR